MTIRLCREVTHSKRTLNKAYLGHTNVSLYITTLVVGERSHYDQCIALSRLHTGFVSEGVVLLLSTSHKISKFVARCKTKKTVFVSRIYLYFRIYCESLFFSCDRIGLPLLKIAQS